MKKIIRAAFISPLFQSAYSFQPRKPFSVNYHGTNCQHYQQEKVHKLFVPKFNGKHYIIAENDEHNNASNIVKHNSDLLDIHQDKSHRERYGQDRSIRLHLLLEQANDIMKQINDEVISTKSMIGSTSSQRYPLLEQDSTLMYSEALEHARSMDSRYGVCSQESEDAWEQVDEMYMKHLLSSQCREEDNSMVSDVDDICFAIEQVLEEFEEKKLLMRLSKIMNR